MREFFLAYVPVINRRYWELADEFRGAMGVLGRDILVGFLHLAREVRALKPEQAAELLGCLLVNEVTISDLIEETSLGLKLVMPDEDVSRAVAEAYLPDVVVEFRPIWLRWDRQNALSEQSVPDGLVITQNQFLQGVAENAYREATRSSDWWRQVGATLLIDGHALLTAYNHHLPTPWSPDVNGDPRFNFSWDDREGSECFTAIHAEAALLARAARRGIPTERAEVFVTTFPCQNCARLLVEAGIKRVYYCEGYSRADAWEILRFAEVEVVLVQ